MSEESTARPAPPGQGAPPPDPPRRRRRTGRRGIDLPLVVLGAMIVLLCAVLIIPLVGLVWAAFGPGEGFGGGEPSLDNFRTVLSSDGLTGTLLRTLALGVGSVVVMLVIAVPLAWLYTRTDLRGKTVILFLAAAKMAIPGFLVALGYIFMFNPSNGIINTWWGELGGSGPLTDVYSLKWIILLQGLDFAGPAFFMLVPTLRVIDVNIEEAAAVHGIPRWRAAVQLLLPIAAPAIAGVSIFFFIVAVEVFDYAGMLGMPARITVLSTLIYQYSQGTTGTPEYGNAAAIGLGMALAIGLIMFGYYRAMRRANQLATVTGKRAAREPIRLSRRGRRAGYGLIGVYALVGVALPVLMLIWASLLPYLRPPSFEALGELSFAAYTDASYDLAEVMPTTLLLVAVVPTAAVAFAACAGWLVTRTTLKGRRGLDVLIMMTLAIPSIVMAVSFLYVGLSTYRWVPLYGTAAFLALVVACRFVATAYRTLHGTMLQVHSELEEAAAVSGIRRGRTFVSVVLPAVRGSLVYAWFWIALLTIRELTITLILSSDGTDVMSTRIFGYSSAGETSLSAALGVIQLGMITVLLIAFCRVARRQSF
ncbi:ABC transporter permease [Streptomyces albipurpureus]|uniref:ABC transporter permease subunit n=1 Tax=Streptomyces albipurpureus TaxID=2897419 RepID=A0ABT0UQ05_9ACTN|nr:ABC transporter permease subunit [Streptomyces sp. CWNU-1]MCM2390618.1 ABC transporter permease subunit [Streptomyces sp. CWNU-1]